MDGVQKPRNTIPLITHPNLWVGTYRGILPP